MVVLLERKVRLGRPVRILGEHVLRDVDASLVDPEGLPRYVNLTRRDVSYFFTTKTTYEGAGGDQPTRLTPSGCWKGIGRVHEIRDNWDHQGPITGFKKIFYYYKGKSPEEEVRTCWVMK